MMIDFSRRIGVKTAAQGGFSSRGGVAAGSSTYQPVQEKVVPEPVPYQPALGYALGWLFEDYVYNDGDGTEKLQITAISGDGSATAQSVLYSPGSEVYVLRYQNAYVVPVDDSTLLVAPVLWDRFGGAGAILWPTLSPFAGTAGAARKGYLVGWSTCTEVDISESLAEALADWATAYTEITPSAIALGNSTVCVGNSSIFTGGGTVSAAVDDTSTSGFSQYNLGSSSDERNASLFNQFKAETLPWTVSIDGTPVSKTTTGAAATGAAIQMGQLPGGDEYGDDFSALIGLAGGADWRPALQSQFGMTLP